MHALGRSRSELTPAVLTALADTLRARPLGPRPEFRVLLRQQLLAAAAERPAAIPLRAREAARRVPLRLRGTRVAIAGLAASIAVTGFAMATVRSLPGQPFYDVKRAAESLQLTLSGSDVDKGLLHLEFARTRLHEVRALVRHDEQAGTRLLAAGPLLSPSAIPVPAVLSPGTERLVLQTLRDMDDETRDGAQLLQNAYLRQRSAEPLAKLTTFAASQQAGLAAVLPTLPVPDRSQAHASLRLLTTVRTDTAQLLVQMPPTAGPSPAVTSPSPTPSSGTSGSTAPTTSAVSPTREAPTDSPDSSSAPTPSPSSSPTTDNPSPSAAPTTEPSPSTEPPSPISSPDPSTVPPSESPSPAPTPDPTSSAPSDSPSPSPQSPLAQSSIAGPSPLVTPSPG